MKPKLDKINNNFEEIAPDLFFYNPNASNAAQISRSLKEKYLNNQPITDENSRDLGKIFSDSIVNYAVHRTVSLVRKFTDIYYFVFDIANSFTYMMLVNMDPKIMSKNRCFPAKTSY